MVRRVISALALTAFVAVGASAQFSTPFQFVGDPTLPLSNGPDFYMGNFTDPSSNALTGEVAGTAFQIWCVDPMEAVFLGTGGTYANAIVTPFNSGNFSNTEAVKNQLTPSVSPLDPGYTHGAISNPLPNYETAAALALLMTPGNQVAYQDAIWYEMGYSNSATINANALALINGLGGANFLASGIVAADWSVISGPGTHVNINGQTVGTPYGNGDMQEFIYYHPSGGKLDLTPEPATMSLMAMGLVGMAGTSIRRRKQRKA